MAWAWSHTPSAQEALHVNIHSQTRRWLETVFAEWAASQRTRCEELFDPAEYDAAMQEASHLPTDVLAEFVWELTEKRATCTSGGWEAYCCPYECHSLPFSS